MKNCIFEADALEAWTRDIFAHAGFSNAHASLAANVLIRADLRGIDSHGVARLSGYLRLIDQGRINPKPNFSIVREKYGTATLDADSGIGLVAAPYAMEIVFEKAEAHGTGWVAIRNSNHFGIAAYHAMLALEHDMIGYAVTNASPLVAPALGRKRMLGTNPICYAIPAGEEDAFVLDMATSAASNGKLEIAERAGKTIPEGWIMKNDGKPSMDPAELKKGGMLLPLGSDMDHGSYKGYGLGAMVDIFSGVLSGANFGPFVPPFVGFLEPLKDTPGQGIGHFLGAMKPDGFREINEFKAHMDLWIREFRNCEPLSAKAPVLIPGEKENKMHSSRKKHGIPIVDKVVNELVTISARTGIPMPAYQ